MADSNTTTLDVQNNSVPSATAPTPTTATGNNVLETKPSQASMDVAELKAALIERIETVFSREWLASDYQTVSKMNSELFIPVAEVMEMPYIKALTKDPELVLEALQSTDKVVLDPTKTMVRPSFRLQRNTIILRDCPEGTTTEEIRALFDDTPELAKAVTDIKEEIQNSWFVSFTDEDITLEAYNMLRQKQLRGQPVKPRIKSESLLKGTAPYAPGYYPFPPMQAYPNGYYPPRGLNSYRGYKQQQQQQSLDGAFIDGTKSARGGLDKKGRSGYSSRRPPRGAGAQRAGGRGGAVANGSTQAASNGAQGGSSEKRSGRGGRRSAGGNTNTRRHPKAQPPTLGLSHFPPLGVQTTTSGYQKPDVKRYSKEQIISILSNTKNVARPELMTTDIPVVSPNPILELETTKPVPHSTQLFEASRSTKRRSSSGSAGKSSPKTSAVNPTVVPPTAAATITQNTSAQEKRGTNNKTSKKSNAQSKRHAADQARNGIAPQSDEKEADEHEKRADEAQAVEPPASPSKPSSPSYADIVKAQADSADNKKSPSVKRTGNASAPAAQPTPAAAAAAQAPPASSQEKPAPATTSSAEN